MVQNHVVGDQKVKSLRVGRVVGAVRTTQRRAFGIG